MNELIYNFGALPDYVELGEQNHGRAQSDVGVRFQLELWRADGDFELRHNQQKSEFGTPDDSQRLKLMWMRPAKGAGFSELHWGDKTVNYPALLLIGRYDDLRWLQLVAEKLSQILEISLEISDMGSDY